MVPFNLPLAERKEYGSGGVFAHAGSAALCGGCGAWATLNGHRFARSDIATLVRGGPVLQRKPVMEMPALGQGRPRLKTAPPSLAGLSAGAGGSGPVDWQWSRCAKAGEWDIARGAR